MEQRERKDRLGQWGVRPPTPLEERTGKRLADDLDGSPLRGKPIRYRARNFRPSVDSYVASLGGPLPWMVRLREIEKLTDEAVTAVGAEWRGLAEACRDEPARFAPRWRARCERFRFDEVNALIAAHNRWFPAEARLAMDVRRRDYVLVNGEPYHRGKLDAAWVLARFPAELEAALGEPTTVEPRGAGGHGGRARAR